MRLALTLEIDSVNMQVSNMGHIVVDVDGVNLSELINKISENGYLLRVVDEPDQYATNTPPLLTAPTYIRCGTTYTVETDNAQLYSLSHQTNDGGESEWIRLTGSGYLSRIDAWSYLALWLKCLGLSKTFRCLAVTLTQRHGVSLIHLSTSVGCLSGLFTFN